MRWALRQRGNHDAAVAARTRAARRRVPLRHDGFEYSRRLAWGVVTALFAPGGWLPNAALAALISPMLLTLLPILIGFTGGRLVYGVRGGVVGAVATMGAIAASDTPMFIGAMLIGPAGGWTIRQIDRGAANRFPPCRHSR